MVKHLSKSAIGLYNKCPFRFYIEKYKNLKSEANYAMKRGVKQHDALYESVINNKDVPAEFAEQAEYVNKVFSMMEGYEVITAEEPLVAYYKDMPLKGLIDIAINWRGNNIVFDYKSGKDRGIQNHRFELALYKYILENSKNIPVHRWGIIFTDAKVVYNERIVQEEEDRAIAHAYNVWQLINENKFPRRKGTACKDCVAKDKCGEIYKIFKDDING